MQRQKKNIRVTADTLKPGESAHLEYGETTAHIFL